MADQWAILVGTGLIMVSLAILIFYLIPLQGRLWLTIRDDLNGLRLRLLLVSVFIVIAASPVITNRILRQFNIESVTLSNVSILSIGLSFLAFGIALVSIYHYKRKE